MSSSSSAGRTKCEGLINRFVGFLREEAKAHHGQLSLDQLEAAAQKFSSGQGMREFFDNCQDEQKALQKDEQRNDVIGRLLVQRFVALLSKEYNPEPDSIKMSRWIIPVFLSLIKMMVGETNYDKYNLKARRLVEKSKGPGPTDWKTFFASEDALSLADDILVDAAMVFEPFESRRDWFVNVINTKLKEHSLATDDTPNRGRWFFQNRHFYRLIDSLYSRIRIKLSDGEQRQAIANRYGAKKINHLVNLIKSLTKSKNEIIAAKKAAGES